MTIKRKRRQANLRFWGEGFVHGFFYMGLMGTEVQKYSTI